MTVGVDKIRIGGSKVRTGCRTCKARRVKCDETRPACLRCVKASRECGYLTAHEPTHMATGHRFVHYVDPNKSFVPSPSPAPNPHTDLDSLALRSLNFFLNSTAPQLEQPFENGTWSQAISCLMHSQPAVKHGLIALAALHENYQHNSRSVFASQRKLLALEHYGRSINEVVQINVQNTGDALAPTLVASLLFCAIESLQGHFASAMRHIIAGVRLLTNCEDDRQALESLPSTLLDALRRIFLGLGMQAMAMEESIVQPALLQLLKKSHFATPCSFSTIRQAQAEITLLQIDGMRISTLVESCQRGQDLPNPIVQQAHQALCQRYRCWSTLYHDLLRRNSSVKETDDYRKHVAFLKLRIHQLIVEIMLATSFTGEQMSYDVFMREFEIVVSTAEEISRIEAEHQSSAENSSQRIFSVTLGIIPAMFYACVRCRDYLIRRRALAVLKAQRRRESIWDAALVASVVEQVIAVETEAAVRYRLEAGLSSADQEIGTSQGAVHTPADVPESQRIKMVTVDFFGSQNMGKVSLNNIAGSWEHHKIFVWDE